MKKLPKIGQLNNLRSIIICGSIRAAAMKTHQTQSAMTRSIQELEQIIGAKLLQRSVNGVELTKIGHLFEPKMHLILNELERAMEEVKQAINSSHGSIVIGCSHLPAFGIMTEVIKQFQERYPFTKLSIIEGQFTELLPSIKSGRLDFYIGMVSPGVAMEGFQEEILGKADFYVFARKDHPLIRSSSLMELRDAKWFLPGSETGFFGSLENTLFPNGKGRQCCILYGDSVTVAQQLILDEDYLSIGPREIINSTFIKGRLSTFNLNEKLPSGCYSIIRRIESANSEVAQWLINEIRREFVKFSFG